MNETYKLVGIMNLFNIYPDFTFPIFKWNNRYYFQVGSSDSSKIVLFNPVKSSALVNIVKLNSIKSNVKRNITKSIGDSALFSFSTSKDETFIGNYAEVSSFLSNYEAENHILKEIIDDFLQS